MRAMLFFMLPAMILTLVSTGPAMARGGGSYNWSTWTQVQKAQKVRDDRFKSLEFQADRLLKETDEEGRSPYQNRDPGLCR
jgi:hypothetical protein